MMGRKAARRVKKRGTWDCPKTPDGYMKTPPKFKEEWYFTFGCGQEHHDKYVVIEGTFESARAEMFKRFGEKWCFQYSKEQFGLMAEEYGLTRL